MVLLAGKGPVFYFKDKDCTYDFGIQPEGLLEHGFLFENSGDAPLLIANVVSGCGCMMASWPKEPVLPGKTAVIKVILDTRTRTGHLHKSVTVYANTDNNGRHQRLILKGFVTPGE
jgi:hypothetical protein